MSVLRFKGIPYATAVRFGRPELVRWLEIGGEHGPIAPQPHSRLAVAMGDYERPMDEDCLTLTVATPGISGRRPVIVFLHGGAYLTGGGSLDCYDGGVLAERGDCVVVGVNYRLGALGWLCHPEVAEGNAGLWDMVAALRFVQAHIGEFGGDAGNVTVMGQSAGGHAIMCLLTMPETEGLFHKAILQSPPPALAPLTRAQAGAYAETMAESAGVPVAGLVGLPLAQLMELQMQLVRGTSRFADISPPFIPVDDDLADVGDFIAVTARTAVARGVAMIVGTTREEMHAFFAIDPGMKAPDPALVAARFAELAGDAGAIELYRRRRPGGAVMDWLGDLVTDHLFLLPSLALAQAVAAAGGTAFVYQFDWAAPGNAFAACHCIELPFVFGDFAAYSTAGMLTGGDAGEMAALSEAMARAWAGFARTGDPAAPGLPWPRYEAERRMTMVFDRVLGVAGDPAGAAWRGGFGE